MRRMWKLFLIRAGMGMLVPSERLTRTGALEDEDDIDPYDECIEVCDSFVQLDIAIEAVDADSNSATEHLRLGNYHSDRRQYALGIADYTKAIELDPNNVLAHYKRGSAYLMQGRYRRAVKDWQRCRVLALEAKDSEMIEKCETHLRAYEAFLP